MFGFNRYDLRLLINLFKMNVRDRYLGSSLGSFWAISNPLFMLALYTYIFGFVFKVKLPGAETTLAYVIWLISGYGPWIATTEAIMGAANSVVGASGLVKNMAFKTELLPIAGALVGAINLAVSFVFLLVLLAWAALPVRPRSFEFPPFRAVRNPPPNRTRQQKGKQPKLLKAPKCDISSSCRREPPRGRPDGSLGENC